MGRVKVSKTRITFTKTILSYLISKSLMSKLKERIVAQKLAI